MFLLWTLIILHTFFYSVSNVDFEQVNISLDMNDPCTVNVRYFLPILQPFAEAYQRFVLIRPREIGFLLCINSPMLKKAMQFIFMKYEEMLIDI